MTVILPVIRETTPGGQVFVTADIAAFWADVPRGKLRVWAHRMTVPVACDVRTRRTLFDLEAVTRHANKTRVLANATIGCNAS